MFIVLSIYPLLAGIFFFFLAIAEVSHANYLPIWGKTTSMSQSYLMEAERQILWSSSQSSLLREITSIKSDALCQVQCALGKFGVCLRAAAFGDKCWADFPF
jgi:hypothetical protein